MLPVKIHKHILFEKRSNQSIQFLLIAIDGTNNAVKIKSSIFPNKN